MFPIDQQTQKWMDYRIGWIIREFGIEAIYESVVLLPTADVFQKLKGNDEKIVKTLFEEICRLVQVDPKLVRLTWIEPNLNPLIDQPAGLYYEEQGQYCIALDRWLAHEPIQCAATIAHELCHARLLGENRIAPSAIDHEPLTDLLTVFFGCGVITANATLSESSHMDGSYASWKMVRRGYLTMPMYGYALAVFSFLRRDRNEWEQALRLDVRAAFRQSLQVLALQPLLDYSSIHDTGCLPNIPYIHEQSVIDETASAVRDQIHEGVEVVACFYCGETIENCVGESYPICDKCRASIEANEQELNQKYEQDLSQKRHMGWLVLFGIVGIVVVILAFLLFGTLGLRS